MTHLLALQLVPSRIFRIDTSTGQTEVLVEDAGPFPDGIVVLDGTVYWTTMGEPAGDFSLADETGLDFSRSNGGLHAIGLDGTEFRDLVPDGSLTTGKQLTGHGPRLYWSDREGCRVTRCRTDGTKLADLVSKEPGDQLDECVGVAVDEQRGWIYWTQKGPSKGGLGRILRAPLNPTDGRADLPDVETLWEDLPEPIDIELSDGYIYWTDRGAGPEGNTLNRGAIPEPAKKGEEPEILAQGFQEAIGLAVDVERETVFVSDLSGAIRVVPLPGSSGEEGILAAFEGPMTGLAMC
ncbi:hypothetical protein [Kocuria sp. TGY1127_2]|uniref:hypothetical protein n=1 Tax=Kocuria sp. TGY1127_2 TaxID=2711328 RepID=UPI0015BBF574|nr:hypothetical protein [Kocuria sp. TGY1127_2]